ncbi:MAG: ABC-F family ATP-binding cassette domain-containing protein, partial [Lachnospiraceae bacterium]|nr:ABC-F family ATP-binding cassette domain-containing protein [Lachnospiraceae bacterium]
EKMLEKIERVEKPTYVKDDMNLKLTPNILSGNDVLAVKNVSKSFGDLTLFDKANFEIKRGEKVAIIGNNGTGKTTMLKIINGLTPSDSGEVILGAKVYVGYYDQEHHVLDPDKSLYQEISDAYPRLDNTQIRNTLAAFLFTGDDVFKLVKELSGGEKGRVSLAKLMLSKANFLILDEPTNHLDITSKEILEEAIAGYEGTVLYVSHDRYFINKTATRILELRDGQFLNFPGNYDRYLEKKDIYSPASDVKKDVTEDTVSETKRDWAEQKKDQAALRKRKNDLKKCEDEIADIESQLESIDAELLDESVFTDHAKLMEITGRKKELEDRLSALMEQWEELASEQ